MAFLKPQSPMTKGNDYFYPLTTADQVILDGGYRLDQVVGHVEKQTITLYANGWSAAAPYSQSFVVKGLTDKLKMEVFPHYPDDHTERMLMKEECAKISFCERNDSIVSFECWDEVPKIDIDVDIEVNVMYPIEMALEEEVESRLPKLNYSVVGGTGQPSNPTENMIWVETDYPIIGYIAGIKEPKNIVEGMVWIKTGSIANVGLHSFRINDMYTDEIFPIYIKQYVNNKWIYKLAKIYQNNIWIPLNTYIFASNIGINSVLINKFNIAYGPNSKTPIPIIDTSSIRLNNSHAALVGICTDNIINLREFNVLKFRYKCGDGAFGVCIDDKNLSHWPGDYEVPGSSFLAKFESNNEQSVFTEAGISIENLSEGYIKILSWEQATFAFEITDIWLE